MMKSVLPAIALGLVVAMTLPASADSLFDDLGGMEGVKRIATDAIDLALADPRIKATFDESNIPRLKGLLAEQFCQVTGGPCVYKGKDMHTVHAPLHLTDADFNALVEDLEAAMDKMQIPYRTQTRFLALLAPMERDSVTR